MAGEYTITLPDVRDTILIPGIDDVESRRRRLILMKTANSPLPQSLRWVPKAMNYLDDVQDFLVTALPIGVWVAKNYVPRLLPGLGWILTVADLLDIINAILGKATGNVQGKLNAFRELAQLGVSRTWVLQQLDTRMSTLNYVGYTLQAGQVLRSLTGYGLMLGGVMGCVSDFFWGTIRSLAGQKVILRLPAGPTPEDKAARVLSYNFELPILYNLLGPTDKLMVDLALWTATNVLRPVINGAWDILRAGTLPTLSLPNWIPWNPATQTALADAGIDPNADTIAIHPTETDERSYQTQINAARAYLDYWEDTMAHDPERTSSAWTRSQLYKETAENAHEMATASPFNMRHLPHAYEVVAMRWIELGLFPPQECTREQVKRVAQATLDLANPRGGLSTLTYNEYRGLQGKEWAGSDVFIGSTGLRQWIPTADGYGYRPFGCEPIVNPNTYRYYLDHRQELPPYYHPTCELLQGSAVGGFPLEPTEPEVPGDEIQKAHFIQARDTLHTRGFTVTGYEIHPTYLWVRARKAQDVGTSYDWTPVVIDIARELLFFDWTVFDWNGNQSALNLICQLITQEYTPPPGGTD